MTQQSIFQQAIYSGLLGGIGTGGYLVVSRMVDPKLGYDWANFVGLIVSFVIDFHLQQLVFVGKITNHARFWWKFSLVKIGEILLSQAIFAEYIKYIKEKNPKFYHRQIKHRVLLIRYVIQLLLFVIVTFPMRKYFIFV